MSILKTFFAIGAIGFGLLMLLGGMVNYFEGKETLSSFLALGSILGVFPVALGTYMLVQAQKSVLAQQEIQYQQKIIRLAQQHEGFVVATEVALELGISLEKAQSMLENLQQKGFFELRISPKGDFVYRIMGSSAQDKEGSLEV